MRQKIDWNCEFIDLPSVIKIDMLREFGSADAVMVWEWCKQAVANGEIDGDPELWLRTCVTRELPVMDQEAIVKRIGPEGD